MNDIDFMVKSMKYINILRDHHVIFDDPDDKGVKKMIDDMTQILMTLPAIVDLTLEDKPLSPSDITGSQRLILLDELKLFANLVMFIDSVKPIAQKYNPSDEDKKKFLEFIGYKENET